jgi:hypothetical protein
MYAVAYALSFSSHKDELVKALKTETRKTESKTD